MPLQRDSILADKYRIEVEIGRGSFGQVYRAQDITLNRPVAIKELLREGGTIGSSDYAHYADRFRREAQVHASLTHPHIVHVYELLPLPPEQPTPDLYLVMEYVDGGSLRDLLQREQRLPVERAVAITQELLAALTVLNDDRHDIVHRDIKPSNILLTGKGQVKLSDFGLAQIGNLSGRTMPGDQNHPGTPLYMSPEQEKGGTGYLYQASDLFTVGCVLFEMLTGRNYKQALGNSREIGKLWATIPSRLRQIMQKALKPEREERFETATEFSATLTSVSSSVQTSKTVWLPAFILLLFLSVGGGLWAVIPKGSLNEQTFTNPATIAISTPLPETTTTASAIIASTSTSTYTATPSRVLSSIPTTTPTKTKTPTSTQTPTIATTSTRRPTTQLATTIATQIATVPPATLPSPATNTPRLPTATNTSPPPATNTSPPPATNTPPPPATNTPPPPATNTSPPPATETPSTGATRPPTPTP